MKILIAIVLVIALLLALPLFTAVGGCASEKTLCRNVDTVKVCKIYPPCGLFDQDECKDPDVRYKVSIGNIICDIIFIEIIFVPVVLAGWYLWEPVGYK